MAFTGSGWTINFRPDLLQGKHNFNLGGDVFKMALYTSAATLDLLNTVVYTSAGEVVAATYTTGGNAAISVGIMQPGTNTNGPNPPQMAYVSFQPIKWPLATFTCRGALLYNVTKGNAAVAIMDFGQDRAMTNEDFQIAFNTSDPSLAPVQVR